ncbi:hypothetical protein WI460_15160 [Gemmatimonadota bacterium Y43]|uniref:hypothetical protein n=1 Tax=Gaopeijia maritima TaxID=3119007 RepID=UPI003276595C
MRALPKAFASLVLLTALAACATASVSYSDVAPGSTPVSAESSKLNFLGLTPTSMERLAELRDELAEQCGDRGVTGVVARTSTMYAVVGYIEKVELRGYCAES